VLYRPSSRHPILSDPAHVLFMGVLCVACCVLFVVPMVCEDIACENIRVQ